MIIYRPMIQILVGAPGLRKPDFILSLSKDRFFARRAGLPDGLYGRRDACWGREGEISAP
jgi:hypothetical protein